MKRIILILIILLVMAGTAVAETSGHTYHWLMTNTDDAYMLCDGGQFTITVNGADSIYIRCIPASATK